MGGQLIYLPLSFLIPPGGLKLFLYIQSVQVYLNPPGLLQILPVVANIGHLLPDLPFQFISTTSCVLDDWFETQFKPGKEGHWPVDYNGTQSFITILSIGLKTLGTIIEFQFIGSS